MADISDAEQAVVDAVTAILYPAGASQPSIVGTVCRVYRGWPNALTLNTDLSVGTVNVTVVSDNESGRTTTRYLPVWQSVPAEPGVLASTANQSITIFGNPLVGDVVGVLVDGAAFAYRIKPGDCPALVASNLALLVCVTRPAIVQATTVIIPGAVSIRVRVVCDNVASSESRRQEKDIRIICWCPTPPVRDAAAADIDLALDQISFLVLADATKARITYKNTASYDQAQNALLYRRDLLYLVEYATVSFFMQPSMLFGGTGINGYITYG